MNQRMTEESVSATVELSICRPLVPYSHTIWMLLNISYGYLHIHLIYIKNGRMYAFVHGCEAIKGMQSAGCSEIHEERTVKRKIR